VSLEEVYALFMSRSRNGALEEGTEIPWVQRCEEAISRRRGTIP